MIIGKKSDLIYKSSFPIWTIVIIPALLLFLLLLPNYWKDTVPLEGLIIMLLAYLSIINDYCVFCIYNDRIEIFYPLSFYRKKKSYKTSEVRKVRISRAATLFSELIIQTAKPNGLDDDIHELRHIFSREQGKTIVTVLNANGINADLFPSI